MQPTDPINIQPETWRSNLFMDDENDITELKKEINNLIWMHAPDHLTLGKAETIACNILEMVREGRTIPSAPAEPRDESHDHD